jgi:hypothetical protein
MLSYTSTEIKRKQLQFTFRRGENRICSGITFSACTRELIAPGELGERLLEGSACREEIRQRPVASLGFQFLHVLEQRLENLVPVLFRNLGDFHVTALGYLLNKGVAS